MIGVRSVPGEPGRLLLARLDGARQRDLKRPLPERQPREIVPAIGQVIIDQPVEPVYFPVQLLLHGNHPARIALTLARSARG